jgi:hypothetical protein
MAKMQRIINNMEIDNFPFEIDNILCEINNLIYLRN